jgi:hypothetical protein
MFTKIVNTLFGEVRVHGGLATRDERPAFGSWRCTLDNIKTCPYWDEINIDRMDFFSDTKGREVHSVTISADGPNSDDSFHHSWIGHWSDFKSKEEADYFTQRLMKAVERIHGYTPPVYYTHEAKNKHAGWVMSGEGKPPETEWGM